MARKLLIPTRQGRRQARQEAAAAALEQASSEASAPKSTSSLRQVALATIDYVLVPATTTSPPQQRTADEMNDETLEMAARESRILGWVEDQLRWERIHQENGTNPDDDDHKHYHDHDHDKGEVEEETPLAPSSPSPASSPLWPLSPPPTPPPPRRAHTRSRGLSQGATAVPQPPPPPPVPRSSNTASPLQRPPPPAKHPSRQHYQPLAEPRLFTDASGAFTTTASLLALLPDGRVLLHKSNGVRIAVPLSKLSGQDICWVFNVVGAGSSNSNINNNNSRREDTTAAVDANYQGLQGEGNMEVDLLHFESEVEMEMEMKKPRGLYGGRGAASTGIKAA